MGRSFYSCCGTDPSNNNESKNNSREKGKKRTKSSLNSQSYSKEPDNSKLNPKLNMINPYTIKLLTDIGELKSFQHNTIENEKLQQDLKVHADILARLENPMAFQ